ncbi:hypothetical protein RHSIM_Rhsim02G0229500 [Rhododendron simsii]|uniref:RNase H type-1 domain-containing protein n=1 Tax=Rhododendron simsii TaxID=118357 RepID=A0A834LTC9_RHOSS|nr:hypothetical protein RHSIM_Rhsim02G0229500 [Rhododendron simsii]
MFVFFLPMRRVVACWKGCFKDPILMDWIRLLPRWKGRWWLALNSHSPNADFGLECSRSWATFDFPGLKESVLTHRPSIIFIMESRNKENKMESLRRSLKFQHCFYVNPVGLAGGLALWWNTDVSISVEYASNNVIHTLCESLFNSKKWATTFVYGSPTVQHKEAVWDQIRDFAFLNVGPWFCLGDFNDVAMAKEKSGGRVPSTARISAFNDFLNDCALIDLGFKGQQFTWRNNRVGADAVLERLDKAYTNLVGREAFPQAMVFHESAIGSDHCPIILSLEEPLKVHRPFRFESMWTTEEECERIIKDQWESDMANDNTSLVVRNLDKCKRNLQAWHRRKFKDIKEQIASLKNRIDAIQGGPCSYTSNLEEGALLTKLNKLWEQDEMYWHQRSRLNYLRFGDRHNRFFHITATQRRQMNLILRLKNEREEWVTSPRGISDIISHHFHSIYTDVHPYTNSDRALSGVSNKISADSNANLCKPVSDLEITSAAWGKVDAIIESDCQLLINVLQPNAKQKNWTIQALLDDISSLSSLSNIVFNWCNRKANRCANWIACASRSGFVLPLSPCNLPVELCSLIRLDL